MQELVFEFKMATTYTGKLRVKQKLVLPMLRPSYMNNQTAVRYKCLTVKAPVGRTLSTNCFLTCLVEGFVHYRSSLLVLVAFLIFFLFIIIVIIVVIIIFIIVLIKIIKVVIMMATKTKTRTTTTTTTKEKKMI